MSTYVDSLIDRYIPKGLLIDANLALLYLVGGYDLRLIGDGKYNKESLIEFHLQQNLPSGAKAHVDSRAFAARLKSFPFKTST
jgi:hypothetical protein